MKQINLNLYRSFAAVYDNGSMSAAAKALGIKQPTATHNIRELEKSLGVILFSPHARGVTPTKSATALYNHIKEGLASFEKAEKLVK